LCKEGSNLPWEENGQNIRSGHRNLDEFQSDTLRTITLSENEGIKAVIGKQKNSGKMEVVSYLFAKERGWDLQKAKAWFEKHHTEVVRERVSAILPFKIIERILDKPLHVRGIAMTAGMSRNFNVYTAEELQVFANKLVSAPVYVEHVAVPAVVGKVVKTEWDGQCLWYEAEIYDDEVAAKIRNGLIRHVSVGADYEAFEIIDGVVPHGLHNAELSLVAVPGIPETNIQVVEKLQTAQRNQPIVLEGLLKNQKPMISVEDVVIMIQNVLPTIMVERSWGLGPARMCQELRGVILNLRGRMKQNA
jgi:hypothetical protein